jgi:hypothetical protein
MSREKVPGHFVHNELVLAVALGQIGTLRRHELDRAWLEWHQRPTAETREALERQKRIAEVQRVGISAVVFVVLAGATIFVFWLRRGEQERCRQQPPRLAVDRLHLPGALR